MGDAVREAIAPLRPEAQRQVVLVTDGQIGFETEIVGMAHTGLPAGSRLHTVGVGEAVNRALTRPAARAGRGVEVIVPLDEDPERASARIVAATRRPIVTDLAIGGSAVRRHVPARLPDLLSGSPVLVPLGLDPAGGEIVATGRTPGGPWQARLAVGPIPPGADDDAVPVIFAREQVEDLETAFAAGEDRGPIDRAIEAIGLQFGIATRLTSWVAISEEPSVDPRQPVRRVRIPQELPHGMSAEGLGLRPRHRSIGTLMALDTEDVCRAHVGFFDDSMPEIEGWDESTDDAGLHLPGRLSGSVRDGVVVFEFEVLGGTLDWRPDPVATLELQDGTELRATVAVADSTVAGKFPAGHLVRLAIRIPGDLALRAQSIRLVSGGVPLQIEL
jgi:hypothetical protein